MSHFSPSHGVLGFNDLGQIHSAEDLFALALAVEHEGVRRYDDLYRQMLALGNLELARLFASLRDEEQGHGECVDLLAQRAGLGAIPHLSFAWDVLPEGAMPTPIQALTPLQAIRHALLNEQRTYTLFLRIALSTHVLEIRRQAEILAGEELEHVALLSRRELDLQDAQSRAMAGGPYGQCQTPQDIDALRTIAATEAWVSAARRGMAAQSLRDQGERWASTLLQDLSETAESRARSLGLETPLENWAPMGLACNDNHSPYEVLTREARKTRDAAHGFIRLADDLGMNGLAAFANHEADLRLGALAQLTDRVACMEHAALRRAAPLAGPPVRPPFPQPFQGTKA